MCDCDVNTTNVDSLLDYSVQSLGAGLSLYAGEIMSGNDTIFQFNSIAAGSNITISTASNVLTIASTGGGVSSLVNLGSGSALGASITGSTLNLRTLLASGDVTLTQTANNVTINSPGCVNVGTTGQPIFMGLVAGNYEFRNVTAGNGITVASNFGNVLIINSMGVANLGGAQAVLISNSGGTLSARTLLSGSGISVSTSGANIVFNTTSPLVTTVTTLGVGQPVLVDISGNSVRAKSITSAGNILVTADTNNVYLKPSVTTVIPYSGKTILNTYISGSPELSDFLGFGSAVTISSQDAFPADYPSIPTSFIGWVVPFDCKLRRVNTFIKFSIPTVITEDLDIYVCVHRAKDGADELGLVWYAPLASFTTDISVGEFRQVTFNTDVDLEFNWHLYFSFFAHRPNEGGNQNLVEFYTSSSITLVSVDGLI